MLESVDVKLVPMILMLIQCIVIIYKVIHMSGFGVQKCGMQSNKCPQICCAHMKQGFI